MAMVGVDCGSLQADSQPKSFGLVLGRRPLGAVLHSSNDSGELSQWLCHDDSTINIVVLIIIIIIRSTSESRPNSIEGKNVRPYVRPFVRTSVHPQKVSSI